MCLGTRIEHHCSRDQYRCRDNCINSTLACNGQFDCSLSTKDEEGCGMFPCFLEILTTEI